MQVEQVKIDHWAEVTMPDGRIVKAHREITHHLTAADATRAMARARADRAYPPGARFSIHRIGVKLWTVVMDARPVARA